VTPSPRAAWLLLGTLEELAGRLRAAADALDEVEAGWLRGAADLVEAGGPERQAARAEAIWLEELASEARARKTSLLSAWVDATESLRSAIHVHETERGPLVEALFPVWKATSLRRHADQALAAETELQRRLGSAYVLRRLAELTTQSAVGPALEALAAAGAAWAAERERPALSGDEADTVRTRLLGAAQEGAQLLERVRWVVRAALVHRPELLETVFPKRGRPGGGEAAPADGAAVDAPAAETVAAAQPDSGASSPPVAAETLPSPEPAPGRRKKGSSAEASVVGARRTAAESKHPVAGASPGPTPGRRKKRAPAGASVGEPARTRPPRRTPAAVPESPATGEATRAPRRRPVGAEPAAEPAPFEQRRTPRAARRPAARPKHAAAQATPSPEPSPRRGSPSPAAPDAPRKPAPRGGRKTSRSSRRS